MARRIKSKGPLLSRGSESAPSEPRLTGAFFSTLLEYPNSVAHKVRGKWVSLEIKDQNAIAGALGVLAGAYERVKNPV
jgi:hypothetical protein